MKCKSSRFEAAIPEAGRIEAFGIAWRRVQVVRFHMGAASDVCVLFHSSGFIYHKRDLFSTIEVLEEKRTL
jgi:hypothetical protein